MFPAENRHLLAYLQDGICYAGTHQPDTFRDNDDNVDNIKNRMHARRTRCDIHVNWSSTVLLFAEHDRTVAQAFCVFRDRHIWHEVTGIRILDAVLHQWTALTRCQCWANLDRTLCMNFYRTSVFIHECKARYSLKHPGVVSKRLNVSKKFFVPAAPSL